ncbi:hypothetical protein [Streptomyces sp. RFCAC02]|uniref:hypothetical protein n=1 Tax=Streptomyces sp. RFCAC02 TaxID=2499143 RepID=UPI0010205F0C|nr:hypothetical protein [Streptomyces sp. RFCAC02]
MSRYRIQFAPLADEARRAMPRAARTLFETEMGASLGRDPYGHGSTPIGKERDRREATVAGAFVVYYVSCTVMVVTAVKIVARP